MDKRKFAVAVVLIALMSGITYALIEYFGQMQISVPVEQAVWIDGKRFNETITETLQPTYGGCTVYANHTLENRGDDPAQVSFEVVNITDSEGNLIDPSSGEITVSFIVCGETVTSTVIPPHSTVNFQVAIHFHYAIKPDVYTVTVQVTPNVPQPSNPP